VWDAIAWLMSTPEQPPQQSTEPTPARPQSNWNAGRVIGMIFASLGGLIGLALLLGGLAIVAAHLFGRDDDGYYTSDREQLESATYAISSEEIDLGADADDWAPEALLDEVRIRVESDRPIFVGIGRDVEVARYLGPVAYDELTDFDNGEAQFDLHQGRRPRTSPGSQDFWAAEAEGSGEQTLTWDADFGRWTAVVMNAAGTRGLTTEADAGVKLDWTIWAGLGLFILGLLMTAGAVVVILIIGRRADRDSTPESRTDSGA
jgi:hypothetical protein